MLPILKSVLKNNHLDFSGIMKYKMEIKSDADIRTLSKQEVKYLRISYVPKSSEIELWTMLIGILRGVVKLTLNPALDINLSYACLKSDLKLKHVDCTADQYLKNSEVFRGTELTIRIEESTKCLTLFLLSDCINLIVKKSIGLIFGSSFKYSFIDVISLINTKSTLDMLKYLPQNLMHFQLDGNDKKEFEYIPSGSDPKFLIPDSVKHVAIRGFNNINLANLFSSKSALESLRISEPVHSPCFATGLQTLPATLKMLEFDFTKDKSIYLSKFPELEQVFLYYDTKEISYPKSINKVSVNWTLFKPKLELKSENPPNIKQWCSGIPELTVWNLPEFKRDISDWFSGVAYLEINGKNGVLLPDIRNSGIKSIRYQNHDCNDSGNPQYDPDFLPPKLAKFETNCLPKDKESARPEREKTS